MECMDFHPKDLPIAETFELKDERDAIEAVEKMTDIGFNNRKEGFRILMPKDTKLAKRMGYTITTGVTAALRNKNEIRDIKYWTYHHDKDHYAIVLISNKVLTELGF